MTQNHHLYTVTVGCPACNGVTQFVETTEEPVALDMDVPLDGKSHCPECGIEIASTPRGEWDLRAEHEIETVEPTQEREA